MDESEILFNLVYFLLCMCIIYPPEEFYRIGLTIDILFSRFLGEENISFVRYHQRRTSLNLFVHCSLPAVYFLVHQMIFPESTNNSEYIAEAETILFKILAWKVAQRFSLMAVLAVPVLIFNWRQQNWRRHPISQTLAKYSNVPQSYVSVAIDISTEYRRPDVYKKKLNSIATVIATENWIIKTSLYNVNFAHQSDTLLTVAKTDTYNVSQDTNDTLQMVNIKVKPSRQGVTEFHIRINALEFQNLQERVNRPIDIPSSIQLHRDVVDRFIEVFKEQVSHNPIYLADVATEKCFACMLAEPNVKINKQCADVDSYGRPLATENCCRNCYCRAMWCVDCLARWFATRQTESDRSVWLEQKCTCPLCRAQFCILDVSFIQQRNDINENSTETTT